MSSSSLHALSLPGSSPSRVGAVLVRYFDALAMASYPLVARAFGYRFRVGQAADIERDARAVLHAVWSAKGVLPPVDAAHYAERYDDALSTWIVAYYHGEPVGVMALLDPAVASIASAFSRKLPPADLDRVPTREIARLAIRPEHRGRSGQSVMVGLLREMLAWCKAHGVQRLYAGSTEQLFQVYRRFNPTAQLVHPADDTSHDALRERYFERLRAFGGPGVLFTFEVAGASPWGVFSRYLGRLPLVGRRS